MLSFDHLCKGNFLHEAILKLIENLIASRSLIFTQHLMNLLERELIQCLFHVSESDSFEIFVSIFLSFCFFGVLVISFVDEIELMNETSPY